MPNEADANNNCGNSNIAEQTDYYTDMGTRQSEVCQSNSEEKSSQLRFKQRQFSDCIVCLLEVFSVVCVTFTEMSR